MRSLTLLYCIFLSIAAYSQQNTITQDTVHNHKPKFIFQIDQRNSFISSNAVNINGILLGLQFKEKHQYSLGIYTLSPWKTPSPIVRNDSTTELIKMNLYFVSLGYTYTFFDKHNFELSIPIELGFGYSNAQAIIYQLENTYKATRWTNFIPGQIGLSAEWKTTRWCGMSFSVGYRKLFLKNIFPAPATIEYNGTAYYNPNTHTPLKIQYDGMYYNYGINLYLNHILQDFKKVRYKIKRSQELRETKNTISIKTGYSFNRVRDAAISSFQYSGINIPFSLEYKHESINNIYFLNISYQNFYPRTNTNVGFNYSVSGKTYATGPVNGLDQSNISIRNLYAVYAYGRKIIKINSFSSFAGVGINYSNIHKKFLTIRNNNEYNEKFYSAGIFVASVYKFSHREKLLITLYSPSISLVDKTLLINHAPMDKFSQLTLYNHLISLQTKISYSLHITQNLSADITYGFSFYQYNIPAKEEWASQTGLLGVSYNF